MVVGAQRLPQGQAGAVVGRGAVGAGQPGARGNQKNKPAQPVKAKNLKAPTYRPCLK